MASSRPKVLAIVLAGGEGKRLMPLTMDRAKPAVPFGGTYRLIDFVLSNLANAGMRQIAVLTQYKSHSLDKHISLTWRMSTLLGNYVTPVPAQQRLGPRWYQGSADAIFQSMNLFVDEAPDYVVVFGADNIYRMDVEQMLDAHIAGGLGCTVAGIRVPREQATEFGVIDAAADHKIKEFLEKPADPPGLPDDPNASFASMGNYIFTCDALVEALYADAENLDSRHDMGGDIIPSFVSQGEAQVYDFTANEVPGVKDRDRPTGATSGRSTPTTRRTWTWSPSTRCSTCTTTSGRSGATWRSCPAPSSPWRARRPTRSSAPGCIISGGRIDDCVLSPNVRVANGATISQSVILQNARIGEGAVIERAILDKNVLVEPGASIGVDVDADRARGYTVSAGGITVVGKGITVRVARGGRHAAAR